jgi:hypothetical protein
MRNGKLWMLWQVDAKSDVNPFTYFTEKYGYTPTEVVVGKGVKLEVPAFVEQVEATIKAPVGCVLIH